MTQPPKEKAKELITHYHNLIQDIGGETMFTIKKGMTIAHQSR
jgi:hypothetical protein